MGQVIQLPQTNNSTPEKKGFPFVQLTAEVIRTRGYGRNARHRTGEIILTPEDDALQTVMSE